MPEKPSYQEVDGWLKAVHKARQDKAKDLRRVRMMSGARVLHRLSLTRSVDRQNHLARELVPRRFVPSLYFPFVSRFWWLVFFSAAWIFLKFVCPCFWCSSCRRSAQDHDGLSGKLARTNRLKEFQDDASPNAGTRPNR